MRILAPEAGAAQAASTVQYRRTLIVSASNSRFMPLLRSLVASIEPLLQSPHYEFACFDIGLGEADRHWLSGYSDRVIKPGAHFGLSAADHDPAHLSFLARPFLREYFPGYDFYVWIDSDIWLQDISVIASYVEGAARGGMAITHEEERAYRFQAILFGWTTKHFILGYGPLTAAYLLMRPHVNAGMFAVAADAPQWQAWANRYEAAIRRSGKLLPHDQFSLNHALHARDRLCKSTVLLDPTCNWICARGAPMWDDERGCYCKPYAPFEPIKVLHLAGPAKQVASVVRQTKGGSFTSFILRGSSPAAPATNLAL